MFYQRHFQAFGLRSSLYSFGLRLCQLILKFLDQMIAMPPVKRRMSSKICT